MPGSHFQLERIPTQKPLLALRSNTVYVVGMEGLQEKAPLIHLFQSEPSAIESRSICVQRRAIGGEDHDDLTNRIDDRTKVSFTFAQPLFGAFTVVNVGCRNIPAHDVAAFVF